jgi:hypothetical protein
LFVILVLFLPTAVLLDENKELVSFGYDAENQFSDLLTEDEHQAYFYFHQFKMLLHGGASRGRTAIFPEHMNSPPVLCGVCFAQSNIMCSVSCDKCGPIRPNGAKKSCS